MKNKNNDKRRHDREKMEAEIYYRAEDQQWTGGCISKDVSESGVCIQVKESFPIGTIIELQFNLPLSLTSFFVKGKIVRVNKMPDNERWEIGLEMLTNINYADLVRKYISSKNSLKSF
jgi:hypothetical protein